MQERNTVERYGMDVDKTSASIIDGLDNEFAQTGWEIVDHSYLPINNNRHMDIRPATLERTPSGKVPRAVFEAVRAAGLSVTGIHTGIGESNTIRVWVETP